MKQDGEINVVWAGGYVTLGARQHCKALRSPAIAGLHLCCVGFAFEPEITAWLLPVGA